MDISTSPSLLQRLRIEGNDRDWEVFFSLYSRPIYGLALHFGLGPEQAEDVVQETMIAIMRRMPEFHYDPDRARFRTWLWRVVKNITITHWRRAKRRPTVALDDANSSGAIAGMIAPDDPGGGADELERTWRLALVREGLRLLEADTQIRSQTLAIFRDLVIGGHDVHDIAARYGVRRNVVDVIRIRLTQRLTKIVAALDSGKLKPLTEPEPPEPDLP
jgi:RNA polymerase sigma-70 factor, ECF subfamily